MQESDKRNKRVYAYFNESEYKILKEQAKTKGLPLSIYIRTLIMGAVK